MKDISVMVVEDSPVARQLLTDILDADPRLRVVCAVDCAEKALRLLPRLAPQVISMDILLPGMDGIEATRRVMEQCPTPIVIVAGDCSRDTVGRSMEALRAGALSVIDKPRIESAQAYAAMAQRLCDQFVNMSQIKLVRRRFGASWERPSTTIRHAATVASRGGEIEAVGIVASTGGPAATAALLRGLTRAFPAPILIVQHMASGFLEGYAQWLASVCDLEVGLARDGEVPRAGRVHVAPGGAHLEYWNGRLRLAGASGWRGHVPSGDALFASLAEALGARAIGVLLTGMGDDGARGLLRMRRAGAHTIAQDRASSAVYGMPAAASRLGAVTEQLAIGAMADRLTRLAARTGVRACPGGEP